MNTEYDVWLGLDVGKTSHHGCGLDPAGERVYDHELPQDEAALQDVITSLQDGHGRVLVIVDQPNTIGALPVAVARDCGADIAYLPGLAMRKAADLYPGQAKTDARDAFIIADTARTMPHTLRSVDRESDVLANLKVLAGTDEDLAHDITRAINRLRSLLLQIHPALERVFKGTVLTRSIVLGVRGFGSGEPPVAGGVGRSEAGQRDSEESLGFLRGGARPPIEVIVAFIDDNRDEFGVEPIVRALKGTAARIAVSSYYAYKKRQPSARARRDQALMVVIQDVYEANYSCYGVRKMWKAINREYADQFGPVARCTVERLMRQLGIDGIRRKRKRPKTASARAEDCPDDLVEREFAAPAPNCLWVADITYVPTSAGWVYTTFIQPSRVRTGPGRRAGL
jgi:hypothetical protein